MSTQLQIIISDCPDDQAAALLRVLLNADLDVDWMDDVETPRDGLIIGHALYTNRSTAGDESGELAALMIEAAPGASFTAWTDPTWEYQGMLVRYVPALGRRDDDCDVDGQAMFTEDQILRALPGGEAAVRATVGAAWTQALAGKAVERTIPVTLDES